MRADLVWSPQAREDLLNIYICIGLDNPDAAERLYTAMESKAALLVGNPRLGMRRPEIQKSARILIESIEIVRVIDGRRDLTAHFYRNPSV